MDSLLGRLRNPEHTGERRCWPCTAVNAALLLVGCAVLARRRSRSLAAALGVGGATAIALRGYLVPATPRFAPALADRLPGDPFHAESDRSPPSDAPEGSESLGGETDGETGEAVLAALLDSGVVVADGEALALDDGFREEWRTEMRDLRTRDDDGLARALGAAAPPGTFVDVVEPGSGLTGGQGGLAGGTVGESKRWFVVSDGSDDPANEQWLTRPVAVAEAAGVRALADRTDLTSERRAQAAGPLRTFLEACPVCDGPVVETTTIECCGGPGGTQADAPDDVLACADCDERLYTFR